jgi:hypothetical protein
LLIVYILELYILIADLLKDSGVVMECLFVVIEVIEPKASLKTKFIEDKRTEVDIQMTHGLEGKINVVFR